MSALAESRSKLVDTPTRLINESNDFLATAALPKLNITFTDQPSEPKSRYHRDSVNLSSSRTKELKRKEQLLGIIDEQSDVVFHDVYENIHKKIKE